LLADIVVVFHFAFVIFVILGGFLVWRWHWVVFLHLPAVVWGVGIEWLDAVCPLTPLEHWLRQQSGEIWYEVSFVEQYLIPILYPTGLTRTGQIILGCLVLTVNIGNYGCLWYRPVRSRL